jgi:hypothetical protein
MNTYLISAIASAWSGMTVMNLSTDNQARHLAAILFALAVMLVIIGVVVNVRRSMAVQWASIPPEQGTADRPVRAPSTPIEQEASPSPTPSYGAAEISPISASEGKPLAGMSFALTGKMPVKRALMECFVEYMGGTLHKRVRKDTRYLVVGESRTVSGKEDKADKWGTPTLSVDELARMCGLTYHDIRDRYNSIVPREVTGARMLADMGRAEVRQYGKASRSQRTYLKELMQMQPEITLSRPVQVILQSDEDMELATVARLKYNASVGDYHLFTTDGEALYLDDLRDCSVSDVIKALAA